MIVGHYATALIADQKFPKGSLLFFLIISQFQDILWFLFHYLGLEPTTPSDVFDATVSNMVVSMIYSHHVLPAFIWGVVVFCLGKALFKSTQIGLVAVALFVGHFILDVFSGHAHHIFGADSLQVGFGFYATHVYLAILIETVFIAAVLWHFFRTETKAGIVRTRKNKIAIIGLFVYGIVFLLSIATVSFRELLGIPSFDLGFNTTMPTIIFTYTLMTVFLYYVAPQGKQT